VLYVAEQGCKWRGLPKRFGRWHTIYKRTSRCSTNGVLYRFFEKLQDKRSWSSSDLGTPLGVYGPKWKRGRANAAPLVETFFVTYPAAFCLPVGFFAAGLMSWAPFLASPPSWVEPGRRRPRLH
jgi:hypothetical protein